MIAHNFRINDDAFSFSMPGQYNAPETYRDLVLLRKTSNDDTGNYRGGIYS